MSAPPPKKTGLSLYADLLEPAKQEKLGATISGAPVKYELQKSGGGGDEDVQKKKDASLKFQPIKRPQVQQKSKAKATPSSSSVHKFSSSTVTASGVSTSSPGRQLTSSTPQQQAPGVQKSNFEDWIGDEEDDEYYLADRRERGSKKKNKNKNKKNKPRERVWDWDDIYDPTLPNSYADYKGSEEQSREIRDWKARLYYRQLREAKKAEKNGAAYSDDEEEGRRPRPMNTMFAPPSNLNFAPPSFEDARPPRTDDDDDYYPTSNAGREESSGFEPPQLPPAFAQAAVIEDAGSEDPYVRRMRMSGMISQQESAHGTPPPAVQMQAAETAPAPPKADVDMEAKREEAQAKIAAFKAKLQQKQPRTELTPPTVSNPIVLQETVAPPSGLPLPSQDHPPPPPPPPPPLEVPGPIISRAPVRYELPPPPADLPAAVPADTDSVMIDADNQLDQVPAAEQSKSSRPGQKGFAERLLKKYGWEKGQGLGAQGEGITTAIVAKAEKRKKLPDAEGGGWAVPTNMGKIVGGKKRKLDSDSEADARFGKMSEVIKLEGMLDGLDVAQEIEENNLLQEIGDQMGEKYGNIERLFVWREEMGGKNEVFVKFTSQLSALRAVNATDGMRFAGNEVVAMFWDVDDFESGKYA